MATKRPQELAALGQAIRDLRAELGLSQEALAHKSGLNRTYVGDIERGERNLSFVNIRRLGEALEVPASELLARGERLERDERLERQEA